MSSINLVPVFDPLACGGKPAPLSADLVPHIARRTLASGPQQDLHTLRVVLDAALEHKMTTVAQIGEELGPKAADVAKDKKNPDPVTYRAVLNFVANLKVA